MESLELPVFKGSAFRGCFGQALKQEVCTFRKGQCEICKHKYVCCFSLLFNSYEKNESKIGRELTKQPHPYLIVPFTDSRTHYNKPDRFGFELTLIGSATNCIDQILNCFKRMGENGIGVGRKQFKPVDIEFLNSKLEYESLSLFGQPYRIGLKDMPEVKDVDSLKIKLETPLRLSKDSKPSFDIPKFKHLIDNLITRITALSVMYCDADIRSEIKESLLSGASQVELTMIDKQLIEQTRFSGTQKAKMQFDGIVGTMKIQGNDLSKWIPLLLLGSYLHVGSTTTFGLGKYSVVID
jgi:hypothetical protein